MRKQIPLILLAAAFGCTQAESPEATPESVVQTSESPAEQTSSSTASLDLPDPSATLVQFYCPGMT